MHDMTLEQKVGQLMLIGWQSDKWEDVVDLIKNYHFGNIILFTRNIQSASQIKQVCQKIQEEAIKYNGVPAFIAIDQEGGSVRRIYEGITNVPGHMAIGAASFSRPSAASDIGRIIGQELKEIGINVVLAPVVDINNNPQNPIIAIRSFSDDPYLVARLASEWSSAAQQEGVLTCYKHFIGHGNVSVDSHLDLPYLDSTKDELDKIELVPYYSNYRKTDAIMTAHILYRSLDDRFPASISKKIVRGILRNELRFNGLVISDCYEMDALARAFSLNEAAIFALEASNDIITVSHSFGRQLTVRNALIEAAKNNVVNQSLIDEALKRVLKYKEIYCKPVNKVIDYERNNKIAQEVSFASITISSGQPFDIDNDTIVIGVTNYINSTAEDKNVENMDIAKTLGQTYNIPYLSIDNKNFNVYEIQALCKNKKVILALADSHLTLVQKVLYSNLIQSGQRIMLISLRTPYDVLGQDLPECHICLYEYTKLSIASLIRFFSQKVAKGSLPVKLDKSKENFVDKKEIRNHLVKNIVNYIDENYAKTLSLDIIAEEFLISPTYLSKLVKKRVGVNLIDYINIVRVNKAKKILTSSTLRVYEVANLCGFVDPNYFTKVFKKVTGVTPNDFRDNSNGFD